MHKIKDITELGILVCETRKSQGLTQERLAAACGVGVRFIREFEHGKNTCQVGKVIFVTQMLGLEFVIARRGEL